MKKILKTSLILLPLLTMVGCQQHLSDEYLIAHPQQLKSILISCQNAPVNEQQSPACLQALQVFSKLAQYGQLLQQDPENFGKQILQAQIQLAELKEQLQQTEQDINKLQGSTAPNAIQLQKAKNNQQSLQTQYQSQQKIINMMLAVASLAGE